MLEQESAKNFPTHLLLFFNCLQKINGLAILKHVNGSVIVQSAHIIVLLVAHLAISSAVVGRRLVGDNRRTVRKSDCTSLSPSLDRDREQNILSMDASITKSTFATTPTAVNC